jgi:death-on-curing protein
MHWVALDMVIAIHKLQIAEHGGADGVRDIGLLESALMRPQNILAYETATDMASLAAAYAFGIAKNHPFLDGNKRTAYVVMETFLILNGCDLKASQEEKYLTFIELAAGNLSEDSLAEWIRGKLADNG